MVRLELPHPVLSFVVSMLGEHPGPVQVVIPDVAEQAARKIAFPKINTQDIFLMCFLIRFDNLLFFLFKKFLEN